MTNDFMDTALNYVPQLCRDPEHTELLKVGEHDDFDPFTPQERFDHQRRIAGDNMEFALKYRAMLEELLKRHNGDGESMMLTILSPTDVEDIQEALAWRL